MAARRRLLDHVSSPSPVIRWRREPLSVSHGRSRRPGRPGWLRSGARMMRSGAPDTDLHRDWIQSLIYGVSSQALSPTGGWRPTSRTRPTPAALLAVSAALFILATQRPSATADPPPSSSSHRLPTCRWEYGRTACGAARARRWRSDPSAMRRSRAAANAPMSPPGTSSPDVPLVMISAGPVGQSKLTTASPAASASSNTSGNPSNLDDRTNTDASRMRSPSRLVAALTSRHTARYSFASWPGWNEPPDLTRFASTLDRTLGDFAMASGWT